MGQRQKAQRMRRRNEFEKRERERTKVKKKKTKKRQLNKGTEMVFYTLAHFARAETQRARVARCRR